MEDQVALLTWHDLRKECKDRGLGGRGTREELERKLRAHLNGETQDVATSDENFSPQKPVSATGNTPKRKRPNGIESSGSALPAGIAQIQLDLDSEDDEMEMKPAPAEIPKVARRVSSVPPAHAVRPPQPAVVPISRMLWAGVLLYLLFICLPQNQREIVQGFLKDKVDSTVLRLKHGGLLVQEQAQEWNRLVAPPIQALLDRSRSAVGSFVDSFVARFKPSGASLKTESRTCAQLIDPKLVEDLVVGGDKWTGVRRTLSEVLRGEKEDSRKALGVLLAAPTLQAGRSALDALAKGLPEQCQTCLLQFETRDWNASDPDLRGSLQAAFVETLQRCPTPVVLVHDLGRAPLEAVKVLLTALSEEGSFQYSGTANPSHGAIVFATVKVPASDIAEGTEEGLKSRTKQHLVARLSRKGQEGLDPPPSVLALRRRFEHVIPLRT
eukprot:jgi/Botrbrau1/19328/Bobra.0073s0059.1